jgi:hypothetical protein
VTGRIRPATRVPLQMPKEGDFENFEIVPRDKNFILEFHDACHPKSSRQKVPSKRSQTKSSKQSSMNVVPSLRRRVSGRTGPFAPDQPGGRPEARARLSD